MTSTILIIVVIAIVVFIILREFFAWYYKINEIINLLKTQNEILKRFVSKELTEVKTIKQPQKDYVSESGIKFVAGGSVMTKLGEFINYPDAVGDAFCLGCRKTDSWKNLYYNQSTDTYYHINCFPDNIKL